MLKDVAPKEPVQASAPRILDADSIAPVAPDPLVVRARGGDKSALSVLKKKDGSALQPEEVLALAVGMEARRREEAAEFVGKLAAKSSLSQQEEDDFFAVAGDERTFRAALVAMADCKSSWGPDLLYEATRRFRFQKDVSEFAMALLLTPQVYKYASPALTTVIDAEVTTECKAIRDLVVRVEEEGDARAVRHMAKFAERTGCGEYEQDDCYPCLRHDRALVDALRAAQGRPGPR